MGAAEELGGEAIGELARRVLEGGLLGRDEALSLVNRGRDDPQELFYWAHRIRAARFGKDVKLCAIIAGRLGGCGEDCRWCAQSARQALAGQAEGPKYADPQTILSAAERAASNLAATFGIVNSGRRPTLKEFQDVLEALRLVRASLGGAIGLCASLGELDDDQACQLAQAGVQCYNHNLETSRRLYPQLVSTHSYDDRLRTLAAAREAGLKLCCGGIFGMGETWEDRLDLALLLRDEVRPAVVPLNFLHPIAGTLLEGAKPLDPMEILQTIAVFRFLLPDADLLIAGGREANLRDLQSWMFYAGATSAIVGDYLTTRGRAAQDDLRMISDLGLRVVAELPGRTL